MSLTRLLGDRRGVSALLTGLLLTTVLGFAGLAIDAGGWYAAKRAAQNAADSAAYSAATAVLVGDSDPAAQARAVTARYGFVAGVSGTVVSVNNGPAGGPHQGDPKAVEVIIQQPARRIFSSLFVFGGSTIGARAVAIAGQTGDACVVALDSTATASALETGKADVNLMGCSLFANSTSQSALVLKGGATLEADSVGLVGGYDQSNNSNITTTNGIHTGQTPLTDPYKDVPAPKPVGCTYTNATLGTGAYSTNAAAPTTFCGGLTINSGAIVTLTSGIYIIDRGDLLVNGGATLQGTGVTIVLTSSTGSGYATVHINGGATINLTAPTSGPTAGLVFFQDQAAPSGSDVFNGGATMAIQGAIYFPRQTVTFSGGSSSTTGGCTQLLASQVQFQGDATLQINCAGTGVRMAGGSATTLVE